MKALCLLMIGLGAASVAQGQGAFNFNNLNASSAVTINMPGGKPGEGSLGDYLGSTYNASLYYSLTPISGNNDPSTLTLLASESAVPFFGTTGSSPNHGPTVDGAGLFDGLSAIFPGTTDGQTIYVEVAVWYGGAGATSYATAAALGYSIGYSAAVPIRLASGLDVNIADLSAMQPFGFPIVPEPSTIVLGGLGGAALLFFRRRK